MENNSLKITSVSEDCIKILEYFECGGNVNQPKFLNAYLCPAGIPTIGIGTTVYPSGIRVKLGDKATVEQAYEYLKHDLISFSKQVDNYTIDTINQSTFDALVDFVYNEGEPNFRNSTFLKRINEGNLFNITNYFLLFDKYRMPKTHKLVPSYGLRKRRWVEANLLLTGKLSFEPTIDLFHIESSNT